MTTRNAAGAVAAGCVLGWLLGLAAAYVGVAFVPDLQEAIGRDHRP